MLVDALAQVGRLAVPAVLARPAWEGQRLLDSVRDPGNELRIAAQPGGEIAAGFREVAAVTQTVIIALPRHVIGRRQHLGDRLAEAGMIVGNGERHTVRPAFLQSGQELLPG